MPEILDRDQLAERLQVHPDQVTKLTREGRIPHMPIGPRLIRYNFDDVCAALRVAQHPDDDAVDTFAGKMRARMAEKRDQGREGWESAGVDELGLKLLRSIADGDPIDVGNYAMMIDALGGGTEHVLGQWLAQLLYERRTGLVLVRDEVVGAAQGVLAAWQDEDGAIKPAMERLAKELSR
jgi:excisionase family DNA binding protein